MREGDFRTIFGSTFLYWPGYTLLMLWVFAVGHMPIWIGAIIGTALYFVTILVTSILTELVYRIAEKIKPTPTEWESYHSVFDDE